MIDLQLTRKKFTDKQTLGLMEVYQDNIFMCSLAILELVWNNNKTSKSCIKKGFYIVEHYDSPKHPDTFQVMDVEGRSYILIHIGNYFEHTEGCLLTGLTHTDIDNDGYLDVKYSSEAMNKLRDICKNQDIISLTIK